MAHNIVLITADQFRYDAMGHCGTFPVKTPHLDALAGEGTSLEAYTPYPMCCPARASIMTGVPPCRHGVYYNGMPWKRELDTLPGQLSANGYFTTIIGKTHFYPPQFHGGADRLTTPQDIRKKVGRKETKPERSPGEIGRTWDEMIVKHYQQKWKDGDDPEKYPGIAITTHALEELDQLAHQRHCRGNAREPFFMWLSVQQPHSPCKPPPPYADMYHPDDFPPPIKTEQELETLPHQLRQKMRGWRALDEETIRDFRARYFGDVSLVDAQVGRVMEKLAALGLRENTIVIFTSDHGEYLGDHHQMQKGGFHECSSRVPLIFSGPGIAAGHRPQGFASLCDLKPTLLDRAGLLMPSLRDDRGKLLYPEWAADPDSISLSKGLQGGDLDPGRVIFSENGVYGLSMMARRGMEKFNYYPDTQEFDWFDLSSDPDELHSRGREVTWETLPEWARDTFARILAECESLRGGSYEYDGVIRPMFT
jgi:arylsulfatase